MNCAFTTKGIFDLVERVQKRYRFQRTFQHGRCIHVLLTGRRSHRTRDERPTQCLDDNFRPFQTPHGFQENSLGSMNVPPKSDQALCHAEFLIGFRISQKRMLRNRAIRSSCKRESVREHTHVAVDAF
jgi:hypothetical protein